MSLRTNLSILVVFTALAIIGATMALSTTGTSGAYAQVDNVTNGNVTNGNVTGDAGLPPADAGLLPPP
ncbi:MAG TPA: hypothetical protein VE544_09150 [Nitrososphaeraceae archaeon]|nr:hypothetical protein [Nitrososphaeraceae archaeon]